MANKSGSERGSWSGQTAFILAAAGSAVGLGNMWKFPFIAGQNGGGAFVLVYLFFIAVVGLPLLTAEMIVGRRSRKEAVGAYLRLSDPAKGGALWGVFGFLAVSVGFVLLSYYSVVGGWTLAYIVKSVTGTFTAGHDADGIRAMFDSLAFHPASIGYHLLFMAITIGIVIGGVRGGLERASKLLMPALGLLMLVLLVRSLMMPGAGAALRFMFLPDFSKLHAAGVLEALGHSFFTLSLGMGAMIAYGSYLRREDSLFRAALAVAFLDTLIAISAGVMIFGIVFSFGGDPQAGPGLVFQTMPVLFSQMPAGSLFATMFFVLLAFAAITSAISILEVVVAYFVDERQIDRKVATVGFGVVIALLGVGNAVNSKMFGLLDYLVSNWLLAIGGMGIALFAGWVVRKHDLMDEVAGDRFAEAMFGFWYFCTRVVAPIAIVFVLLHGLGVL